MDTPFILRLVAFFVPLTFLFIVVLSSFGTSGAIAFCSLYVALVFNHFMNAIASRTDGGG